MTTPTHLPPPALSHVCDLTVFVSAPVEAGSVQGISTQGKRRIVPNTGGSHVYVQNSALRRGSAQDIARLVRGEPVPPERIYFRCVPRFEVENPAHAWMTHSIL